MVRRLTLSELDLIHHLVAKNLGPFVDCTSNQAIAYFELLKVRNPLYYNHFPSVFLIV